jgi:hypothetical protein
MRHREQRLPLAVRAGTLAALSATLCAGCAGPVAELSAKIPKKAAPAAIQAGVSTLADPALRKEIAQILASPEMRDIHRELVAGIADGALDTAVAPERQKKLQRVTGALIGTSVRAVADGLAGAEIATGVSAAMTRQIGPALETTMRDDVGPGLASILGNEDLQRSLGATARVLGREVVLGATEALAQQKAPPEADSLLGRATGLARQGAALFGSAAWVLVLVIALLFAWIVKLLAQARRYRSEATRRIAATQPRAELREVRRHERRPPRERHA